MLQGRKERRQGRRVTMTPTDACAGSGGRDQGVRALPTLPEPGKRRHFLLPSGPGRLRAC